MTRSHALAGLLALCLLAPGCAPDTLEPTPFGPADGWRVFHPLPGGYDLFAVWGDSPADVWAVGAHGSIVHWDGRTVTGVDSPVDVRLATLDAWGRDDIYAAGEDYLLHYDGRAWHVEDRFPEEAIRDLVCADDGRLCLVGSFGLRIRDGDSWRTVAGPRATSTTAWTADDGLVRVGDDSLVWLVRGWSASRERALGLGSVQQGDGRLFWADGGYFGNGIFVRDPQDGWQWHGDLAFSPNTLLDMDAVVCATNRGIVVRDTVTTVIWSNDTGRWIYGLARCGTDGLLACGYGGTLMAGTRNAGDFTWNESALGLGYRHLNAFAGTGCDDIWAGEWWGRVLHYDGAAWTCESSRLPDDRSVSFVQTFADGWILAKGGDEISLRDPVSGWQTITSPGSNLGHVHAATPDSIFAATAAGLRLWNGVDWRDVGPAAGAVLGLAATASGTLHALMANGTITLQRWNGTTFEARAEIPGLASARLCASRRGETLWIGGHTALDPAHTIVYRYEDGDLTPVTDEPQLPSFLFAMTELRDDDLFLLFTDQVWRYHGGAWSREAGLPAEDFSAIWSHPDCGVFVEGHPTFFKDFPEE
ncbi:MAG: hypothetical protein C0395_06730 [Gemmatimonas sp.]|nr:hypothetical protein [Gemmatimonas sp.]